MLFLQILNIVKFETTDINECMKLCGSRGLLSCFISYCVAQANYVADVTVLLGWFTALGRLAT